MQIKYEDFVLDPDLHLARIYKAVGVDPDVVNRTISVRTDTNSKYEKRYCDDLVKSLAARQAHRQMDGKVGGKVRGYGYDLNDYYCPEAAAAESAMAPSIVPASRANSIDETASSREYQPQEEL